MGEHRSAVSYLKKLSLADRRYCGSDASASLAMTNVFGPKRAWNSSTPMFTTGTLYMLSTLFQEGAERAGDRLIDRAEVVFNGLIGFFLESWLLVAWKRCCKNALTPPPPGRGQGQVLY